MSGFYDLTLNAFGQAFTCPFLIPSIGTVRKDSLMTMWMNSSARAWRRKLKNKQNTCLCWCGTAQNNAYLDPLLNPPVARLISSMLNRFKKSESIR